MPLYDFKCQTCGTFEKWVALANFERTVFCPDCSEVAARMFSPPMLLSGSLRLKEESKEPKVVEKGNSIPARPRNQVAKGRPWMIGH